MKHTDSERLDRAKKYKQAYESFIAAQAKLSILRKVPESTESADLNMKVDALIRSTQTEIAEAAIHVIEQMEENKDLTMKDFRNAMESEGVDINAPSSPGHYL